FYLSHGDILCLCCRRAVGPLYTSSRPIYRRWDDKNPLFVYEEGSRLMKLSNRDHITIIHNNYGEEIVLWVVHSSQRPRLEPPEKCLAPPTGQYLIFNIYRV